MLSVCLANTKSCCMKQQNLYTVRKVPFLPYKSKSHFDIESETSNKKKNSGRTFTT